MVQPDLLVSGTVRGVGDGPAVRPEARAAVVPGVGSDLFSLARLDLHQVQERVMCRACRVYEPVIRRHRRRVGETDPGRELLHPSRGQVDLVEVRTRKGDCPAQFDHDVSVVGTPREAGDRLLTVKILCLPSFRGYRHQGRSGLRLSHECDPLSIEGIARAIIVTARGGESDLFRFSGGYRDPVNGDLCRLRGPGNQERLAVGRPGALAHGPLHAVVECGQVRLDQLSRRASVGRDEEDRGARLLGRYVSEQPAVGRPSGSDLIAGTRRSDDRVAAVDRLDVDVDVPGRHAREGDVVSVVRPGGAEVQRGGSRDGSRGVTRRRGLAPFSKLDRNDHGDRDQRDDADQNR